MWSLLLSWKPILFIYQANKLKFFVEGAHFHLCCAAASAVYFEGRVASLEATETWNYFSQP